MALEPSPRLDHFFASVEGQLCLWGGRTKAFRRGKPNSSSTLHTFDPVWETWSSSITKDRPPGGLYIGACTSAGHHLYVYGGYDGSEFYNSLHQLDTRTLRWTELAKDGPTLDGPTKKTGAGMIVHDNKLLLFGGYAVQLDIDSTDELEASTVSTASTEFTSDGSRGVGWTNELHAFDLNKGEEII